MTRFRDLILILLFAVTCPPAVAVTLDDAFSDVRNCQFKDFYYAPWTKEQPIHPYFSERNLKPFKEENGVYYFKVKDTLFGLPVSELIVPGTWDVHGVTFDVPLSKSRKIISKKFGSTFPPSSKADQSPILDKANRANQSVFYCIE